MAGASHTNCGVRARQCLKTRLQRWFPALRLLEATAMVAGFVVSLFVGSKLVPGRQVELVDADGATRAFKLNGLALMLCTGLFVAVSYALDWFSLSLLHEHFVALFIVANVLAFGLSVLLYVRARHTVGVEKGFWRGFILGGESNPMFFGMDLKFFSYRPSLIGLALLNASFAFVQYETYGHLTLAMMLYQVFTLLYVLNYFQFEYGMVHTWDIVSERFGWMLVWGDYVLVPFFYCIAGWWLVHAQMDVSPIAAIALVLPLCIWFLDVSGCQPAKNTDSGKTPIQRYGDVLPKRLTDACSFQVSGALVDISTTPVRFACTLRSF